MDIEQKNRELLKEQGDFIRKSLAPTFDDIKDEIIKGKRAQMGEVREWGGIKMRKEANGWVPVKEGGEKPKAEGEGGGEQKPQDIGEAAKSASEGALQNAIKLSNDPKVREAAHRELERRKNEEATDTFKAPDGGDGDKKKERIEGKNGFTDKSGEWHDTDNPRGDVRYQEKMKEEGRKNYEKEYAQPGSQAAEEQKKERNKKGESDKSTSEDIKFKDPKELAKEGFKKGQLTYMYGHFNESQITKVNDDGSAEAIWYIHDMMPFSHSYNRMKFKINKDGSYDHESLKKMSKIEANDAPEAIKEIGDKKHKEYRDEFIRQRNKLLSEIKSNNKEKTKEEKGRTSDDIKREISETPIGSKASGGGYSEWEKVGKDSWHNKITNSLSHDDGIFSRIGKFDDFKIKSSKSEIKKSLLLQNIEDQDLIEKSHINEFVYNEDMKVSKTGKELKEKFQEQIKGEVEEIREYSTKIQELLQKIGEQPTKKVDEIWYYRVDGWEDKLPILPMIFGDGYASINEGDGSGVKGDKYEYDQLVGRLIDCNIEIIMLNTMIENMKDNKEYKLTVRQAAMLGF